MTMADYVLTLVVAAFAGAIIGPPVGYWSVLWQDKLGRHRARCGVCQRRDTCREPME
jgi:hypothetical protein